MPASDRHRGAETGGFNWAECASSCLQKRGGAATLPPAAASPEVAAERVKACGFDHVTVNDDRELQEDVVEVTGVSTVPEAKMRSRSAMHPGMAAAAALRHKFTIAAQSLAALDQRPALIVLALMLGGSIFCAQLFRMG